MVGTRFSTQRLRAARQEASISTIVDLSTVDIGRDVDLIAEVSRRSGVNVLLATGHHRHFSLTTMRRTRQEFADLFIREITEGIDGTSARAAVIKIASDGTDILPPEREVAIGAAWAHRSTGAPIFAHSNAASRLGLAQIELLAGEGVDLERVCICHCDDPDEWEYAARLVDEGCWIGLDRFPGGPAHRRFDEDWPRRVEVIAKFIERGATDRLLISHDFSLGISVTDDQTYLDRHPDHLLFIHRKVLPMLLARGLDANTLSTLLVDNPRRFLTRETS